MRWATYRRLVDQFDRYDEVVEDHFVGTIGRLIRLGQRRDFEEEAPCRGLQMP
jgi:hypothetical protein